MADTIREAMYAADFYLVEESDTRLQSARLRHRDPPPTRCCGRGSARRGASPMPMNIDGLPRPDCRHPRDGGENRRGRRGRGHGQAHILRRRGEAHPRPDGRERRQRRSHARSPATCAGALKIGNVKCQPQGAASTSPSACIGRTGTTTRLRARLCGVRSRRPRARSAAPVHPPRVRHPVRTNPTRSSAPGCGIAHRQTCK